MDTIHGEKLRFVLDLFPLGKRIGENNRLRMKDLFEFSRITMEEQSHRDFSSRFKYTWNRGSFYRRFTNDDGLKWRGGESKGRTRGRYTVASTRATRVSGGGLRRRGGSRSPVYRLDTK